MLFDPEADRRSAWQALEGVYGTEQALELVRSAGADYALMVSITSWINQGA